MQQVDAQQPAPARAVSCMDPVLARAVSCMTLYDQLDLTLELLHIDGDTYLDEEPVEPWPPNVIRFRVRRPR